ncbi:MAG: YceI family protein [Hyphomicrobiaceae bacterium]|nr:YceI family protein [Hyphomicrobiaceae bacterium]
MITALRAAAMGLALVAAVPAASAAEVDIPAGTYKLDPTHASLTWKVSHLGLSNYTARFAKFDATLAFDPKKPAEAKLSVSVDPASIRTDYPFPEQENFDKKLAEGEDWLNAKAHPAITFTSTKVEMTGDKAAKVTGDLTFLGVTKPVTLDVTLFGATKEHPFTKKAAVGFSAKGSLKRSEFGMAKYVPMIGDEVALQIEAEFGAQ